MYGQSKVSRAKTERMVRMARMEKTGSPVNRVYKEYRDVLYGLPSGRPA